jgi:8-oxo-dGTP pyrophosphatase MutT (NUDIX family)
MLQACATTFGTTVLVPQDKITPRYSAYGIIHNAGSLLLITSSDSGKYWFPGGEIEKDEQPFEAVIRESFEETGVTVNPVTLLWEVSSHLFVNGKGRRQFSSFYLCDALTTTIEGGHNPDHTDDAVMPQWVSLSILKPENFQDFGGSLFRDLPQAWFS